MRLIINTDGGARGNPGPAGIGVVIADQSGNTIKTLKQYIGETTNNCAEYKALILALQEANQLVSSSADQPVEVLVRMDSELIVKQMQGLYKIKEPTLKELAQEVLKLIKNFKSVTFQHVRREQNKLADKLVNEAMDEHLANL